MASLVMYRSRAWRAIASALSQTPASLSTISSAGSDVTVSCLVGRSSFHTHAAGSWHRYMHLAGSSTNGASFPGCRAAVVKERPGNPLEVAKRWLSSSRVTGDADRPDDAGQKDGTPSKEKSASTGQGKSETHAERRKRRREEQKAAASLATVEEEEFSAITDRIPQRPMGAVESTSYSLVILAALGFAAAVLYAALSELIFSPKEYTCFSKTLKKIEDDPRVTIRLGTPMKAYGTESQNRSARQRIPHRIYSDNQGREHVQLQFVAKGPNGRATVHADMYEDSEATGGWRYHYLYLTVESPLAQQVVLVKPHVAGDNEAVA